MTKEDIAIGLVSADRPIDNASQDRLNRGGFSNSVVHLIRSWRGKDSLVIGIRGPWGSGKSSIKNLIIGLAQSENSKIRVLEFTPWEWSNTDRMHIGFFSELAKTIERSDDSQKAKDSAKNIRKYAAYLNAANIQEPISKISTPLLSLFAIFGISISSIAENQWVKNIFAVIALIFATLPLISSILENFANFKDRSAEELEKTASEQNKSLQDDLRNLDYTVLVILDEIDRLNSEELKAVFQMIKANANFPNVIYLIFFDRFIVEREIGKFISGSPQVYLEKIIQMNLDIPQPSKSALWGVLEYGLKQVFSSKAAKLRFRPESTIRLLHDIAQPYFQDMRSVNRYLSNLNFHSSLYDRNVYEVNPLDLSLIEILRMFEPEVYKKISTSKEALTGYISDYQSQRNESDLNDIVAVAIYKESVRIILQALFPNRRFRDYHAVHDLSSFSGEWFENARICSNEIFSRYFQFDIPQQEVSFSEVKSFLSRAASPKDFEDGLRRYLKEGRLDQILHILDNLKLTLDDSLWMPLFISLSNIGDEIMDPPGSYIGPEASCFRIPYWILKEKVKQPERAGMVKDIILNSSGVSVLLRLLNSMGREDGQDQIIQDHELKELQKMLLDKIRSKASSNSLLKSSRFLTILYKWKEWGSLDEVDAWIVRQMRSRESWVALIKGFETEISVSSGYEVVSSKSLHEKAVNEFLKPIRALKSWDDLGILDPSPEEDNLIKALNLVKMER